MIALIYFFTTIVLSTAIVATALRMLSQRPKVIQVRNNLQTAIGYIKNEMKGARRSYYAVFGETSPYAICQLLKEMKEADSSDKDIKFIFDSNLYVKTAEDLKLFKEFLRLPNIKKYKYNGGSRLKHHFRAVDDDYAYIEEEHLTGQQKRKAYCFRNNQIVNHDLKRNFQEILEDSVEIISPDNGPDNAPEISIKDFSA